MLELSLIENIQRENLNPIEEAEAYKRLMEQFHLTQEEISKKVGGPDHNCQYGPAEAPRKSS
jgi:ParB family chromosome partitioning protein